MNIKQAGGQQAAGKLFKKMGPLLELLRSKDSTASSSSSSTTTTPSPAPTSAAAEGTGSWTERTRNNFWAMLHTAAARYPEHPTGADKQSMRFMVAGLAHHYGCKKCAKNLQQFMRNPTLGPVAVENRDTLSRWVCNLHNLALEYNGEEELNCNAPDLHETYLKGCEELVEEEVEYDHHGQVVEKETIKIPHSGPWNPLLYAHDPRTFMATVRSATDEWEAIELDELEQLAMEFNVGSKKVLDQMKKRLRSGKITREELIEKMKKRLEPVLQLKADLAKATGSA